MMKMRWILLLGLFAVLCLSTSTTKAEDPAAEPETAAEPEPESTDEDAKKAGSTAGKQTKAAQNPAAVPWALSIPSIVAIACVAKFIL